MLPKSVEERIVAETNIVEVIGEYVKLKKSGSSYFAVCPFHNDGDASMSVVNSQDLKIFNCFGCHTAGNVIKFVSKFERISYEDAGIKLAKRIGITINKTVSKEDQAKGRLYNVLNEAVNFYSYYLKNSNETTLALDYLHKRGITDEQIDYFHIGLAPSTTDSLYQVLVKKKNLSVLDLLDLGLVNQGNNNSYHDVYRQRIMIPIYDPYDNPLGFVGRVYTETDQARYINSKDNYLFHKNEILFNLNNAASEISRSDCAYILEGPMDVIAATRAGVKNVVASMGTAFTKNHAKKLLNLTKNIVLLFDGDHAGIDAMNNALRIFADFNIIPDSVILPDNQDPDDFVRKQGGDAFVKFLQNNKKPVFTHLYNLAKADLIVDDVKSIEKFKQKVFSFISISKNTTVVSIYLKKICEDTGISADIINNDYASFTDTVVFNNPVPVEEEQPSIINPPLSTIVDDSVKVTVAVKKAYKIIVKHCIYDIRKVSTYMEKTNDFYPGNELATEYSIIHLMEELYLIDPSLLDDPFANAPQVIDQIKKDPSFVEYIDDCLNDNTILIDNNLSFEQSLKTIELFIKKIITKKQKNRALKGDSSAIESFIQSKKEEGMD